MSGETFEAHLVFMKGAKGLISCLKPKIIRFTKRPDLTLLHSSAVFNMTLRPLPLIGPDFDGILREL